MAKLISKCPSCKGSLIISTLQCSCCGMELKNNFEMSPFDQLNSEQNALLISFLKSRGNLKEVQSDLKISYPTAKKKLDELLTALNLASEETKVSEEEEIDMRNLKIDRSSTKASEIIKAKLADNGGRAMVRTFRGGLREISISSEGKFLCPQLIPYDFEVFDAIVDLLLNSPGYRARKGNARSAKLGEPGCEETTVAGTVLLFMGKKPGQSGLDPSFLFSAVLEWAGIAENGRGELILTSEYRKLV